jgi:hypothetical protein
MVTERTGNPSGRPKKEEVPFLQNPKRDYVMILRGTMAVMKQPSIRNAAKVIAAEAFGNLVEEDSLPSPASEVVAACPPGMIVRAFGPRRRIGTHGFINTRDKARAAKIEGAAEFIRQLDRQAQKEARTDPAVARWLRCAISGFILASEGAPADLVLSIFRNSGDPALAASGPGLIQHLAECRQGAREFYIQASNPQLCNHRFARVSVPTQSPVGRDY